VDFLVLAQQAPSPSGGLLALEGLQAIVGLASIVCLILVIVKMIQNGQTGLGIASICCGLIALVVGWQNATAWNIKTLMTVWTILIVINIILGIITGSMAQSQFGH